MWCRWHKSVTNAVQMPSFPVTSRTRPCSGRGVKANEGFCGVPSHRPLQIRVSPDPRGHQSPLFRKLFRFPLPFLRHLGPLTTAHGTKIFAHSCACYYLLLLMSHQGFPSVPSPLFPCAPLSAVLMSSKQNFLFGRTLLHPCKTFMDSFEVAHVHISVHLVYGRKLLLSVNNQSKVDDHI